MDIPHAPLGVVAKLFRWLKDAVAMPGRIRHMVEAAAEDADKRIVCLECGTGRLSGYSLATGYFQSRAVCTNCGKAWFVDMRTGKISATADGNH